MFDLAGFLCGHFLVPFSEFFGATFIGKAIIKVSIQVISTPLSKFDNYYDSKIKSI